MRQFGTMLAQLITVAAVGLLQSGSVAQDDKKAAQKSSLTQLDLDVLRKANYILADESKWNKKC
jgi:hypothetical protein